MNPPSIILRDRGIASTPALALKFEGPIVATLPAHGSAQLTLRAHPAIFDQIAERRFAIAAHRISRETGSREIVFSFRTFSTGMPADLFIGFGARPNSFSSSREVRRNLFLRSVEVRILVKIVTLCLVFVRGRSLAGDSEPSDTVTSQGVNERRGIIGSHVLFDKLKRDESERWLQSRGPCGDERRSKARFIQRVSQMSPPTHGGKRREVIPACITLLELRGSRAASQGGNRIDP
jgi:hypothetical protein